MTDVCQTTWIEQAAISGKELDNGTVIITLTLPNGLRYCIPCDQQARLQVSKIVSPVAVFGPQDIPRNGHG